MKSSVTEQPEHADEWQQVKPVLDQAIHQLPEQYRQVIILHFINNKTYREVSERLGMTQAAVRKRVSRALGKLRDAMAGSGVSVSLPALTFIMQKKVHVFPPPHLKTEILRKIRKSNLSARSARTAAYPASAGSAWTAAAAVGFILLSGAGLFLWKNTAPAGTPNRSQARKIGPQKSADRKIDIFWSFTNTPSPEMKVLSGRWEWKPDPSTGKGEMRAGPSGVQVLLPVQVPDPPLAAELKLRSSDKPLPSRIGLYYAHGNTIMDRAAATNTTNPAFPPGTTYTARIFFHKNRSLFRVDKSNTNILTQYKQTTPPSHLILTLRNHNIKSIRLRSVDKSSLPPLLLNTKAFDKIIENAK